MTTARILKAIGFCVGMGAVIGVAVAHLHIPSVLGSALIGAALGIAVLTGPFSSGRCSTTKN